MSSYEFIASENVLDELISRYEKITGRTLKPASPERVFISWVADILTAEKVLQNYTGNQNIPSRASGGNLDALGEFIYGVTRLPSSPAKCNVRFYIDKARSDLLVIQRGTRVTDVSNTLVWATTEDAVIPAGNTYGDAMAQCNTNGVDGNGYIPGTINTIIDIDCEANRVENTTESDGGANAETDAEFFNRMKYGLDAHSTAGAINSYIYWAKTASNEIEDVYVTHGYDAGEVAIYVLLKNGEEASDTILTAVKETCNADDVRPLTDMVNVYRPIAYSYDVDITYYVDKNSTMSLSDIDNRVKDAVAKYNAWQTTKIGRDINPFKLYQYLTDTGVKRVEITSPTFTELVAGGTPRVATVGTVNIAYGGTEDE